MDHLRSLIKPDFPSPKWVALVIAVLFLFRLLVHLALYRSGFISLTADEFGRTFAAAEWARHPTVIWHGIWLPFHSYLYGSALLVNWELLWAPRMVALLLGAVSIVLMYLLASSLFDNRIIGLIGAFLLSVNPAHIWLSGVPLTEIATTVFLLAALWAFNLYLKNSKQHYLFIAACALALANGFRFEPWIFSVLFSLVLVGQVAIAIAGRKIELREAFRQVGAALIPWLLPLAWVIGNYIETQNLFFNFDAVRTYNLRWYGPDISYGNYLRTFYKIDPYLTVLGIIAVIVSLVRNKGSQAIRWYVAVSLVPLAIYVLLQGGHLQPPGNYIRYFAMFVFLFYPLLGYLAYLAVAAIRSPALRWCALILILGLVATTQVYAAFRYTNDPAAQGLAVGMAIRELREENPAISDQPVIIELAYWQYLAIHVGANDIQQIIYDRELDIAERRSQSLLLTDEQSLRTCLQAYKVSYIIVKDAQLRDVLESQLQLQPTEEVNGYAFFPVNPDLLSEVPADQAANCPLSPSSEQ